MKLKNVKIFMVAIVAGGAAITMSTMDILSSSTTDVRVGVLTNVNLLGTEEKFDNERVNRLIRKY